MPAPEPQQRNTEKIAARRAVYSILWRKKTLKVHKTWEGDGEGFVAPNSSGSGCVLVAKADGTKLGTVKLDRASDSLEEGLVVSAGRFEFEIGSRISARPTDATDSRPASEVLCKPASAAPLRGVSAAKLSPSKTVALSPLKTKTTPGDVASGPPPRGIPEISDLERYKAKGVSIVRGASPKLFHGTAGTLSTGAANLDKDDSQTSLPLKRALDSELPVEASFEDKASPKPSLGKKRFGVLGMAPLVGGMKAPLQLDPFIPLRPVAQTSKRHRSGDFDGPLQDTQVDVALMGCLRPHQVDAVKFLYDCVTGNRHVYGQGAILADEMGLGKSLTAITLIHTLLRSRHIRHALVVCPVTLISNWRAEFRKWLPRDAQLGVMVVDHRGMGNGSLKDPVRAFFGDRSFRVHQVMIVGYERTRLLSSKLVDEDKRFDFVVCDEGHKLKTSGSKTAEAIASIVGDKRVLLTGTPIQNNLNEFWALADFVNPGCFGSEAQFTKKFVAPLDVDPLKAHDALNELSEMCDEFMLRRDASVLARYLSVPKTEYAVFCRPTAAQSQHYAALTAGVSHLVDPSTASVDQGACLQAITELKKAASGLTTQGGGKLAFLKQLLLAVRKASTEKIVIVSGSTKVLDMCQDLCASLRLQWLRLDGQTPQERRQGMVDKFNRQPPDVAFAFLLSSRSGGMGLNLIGGSRLVLVDCDWNPSIDAQAMARIHRDGQTRACHIYRLMSTGTIDEKIFQRQLSKIGLSTNVLVEGTAISARRAPQFTRDQLQDLFTYSDPAHCNTLDMLPESESLKGYGQVSTTDDEVLNAAIAVTQTVSCVLVKR